jgi:hypothetical protein
LKAKAIELAERTQIDTLSYEQFGSILLLMIKNILKKPQFSGYTYRDDFYSDSIHKILKYLGNFNHKLISEKTGQAVNSFAYISQTMHNSIIFIIITKKKENENLRKHVGLQDVTGDYRLKNVEMINGSTYEEPDRLIETIEIDKIDTTLVHEIQKLLKTQPSKKIIEDAYSVKIIYPSDYRILFDEYDLLKPFLKNKLNIVRARDADNK